MNQPSSDGRRTGDSRDRFLARQIRDMDKGVIERSVDVCDTKDELSICDLRSSIASWRDNLELVNSLFDALPEEQNRI